MPPKHARLPKARRGTIDDRTNERIAALADAIHAANERYFNDIDDGKHPPVSDDEYDAMVEELEALAPVHPVLRQVGQPPPSAPEGASSDKRRARELPYLMGSLDKIKAGDASKLDAWTKRYAGPYELSDKLDGVSALLVVTPSTKTSSAAMFTRGDGRVGHDVSHLLSSIDSGITILPLTDPSRHSSPRRPRASSTSSSKGLDPGARTTNIAVRGELIIPRSSFVDNKLHLLGANARNLVSGSVNAKRPNADVLRHIRFVAYEVIEPAGLSVDEQLRYLRAARVRDDDHDEDMKAVVRFQYVVHSFEAGTDAGGGVGRDALGVRGGGNLPLTERVLLEALERRRQDSCYDIDGIVVTQKHRPLKRNDGRSDTDQTGQTKKASTATSSSINYANAFAFKSRSESNVAEVEVERVKWSVSKDGLIKPVVEFAEPVYLSGVSIQRATGFNGEFIQKHAIGPGSVVLVTRSGDVIPHIFEVVRPAKSGKPQMPEYAYAWTASKKDVVILVDRGSTDGTRSSSDPEEGEDGARKELRVKLLAHFVKMMGVEGVRDSTVIKMFDAGIDTPGKIVRVGERDAAGVPGIGPRQAEIITAAIRNAVANANCLTVMRASNAFGQGFGDRKLLMITRAFPDALDPSLPPPRLEDLVKLEGVQITTARAFLEGLSAFREFQKQNAVPCGNGRGTSSSIRKKGPDLSNQTFVFTGFRDADLEKRVEELGGRVTGSVTRNTSALVVKDGEEGATTTKAQKARDSGVRVIGRSEFATFVHL